jgi:hypothetical protein
MPSAGEHSEENWTWMRVAQLAPPSIRPAHDCENMKLPRRKFLHLAVGAAALPAVPQIAEAQAYSDICGVG